MRLSDFYLPSHTIRKVKFLSRNSILTKPQHFHEFFTQIFLAIFLVKSKLSTAKKPKTTTFSRVFHPNKIDNFLGKSKLNFWTKNEDFEQCGELIYSYFSIFRQDIQNLRLENEILEQRLASYALNGSSVAAARRASALAGQFVSSGFESETEDF